MSDVFTILKKLKKNKMSQEEKKQHETIAELIKATYDEWKSDGNFIRDIKEKSEGEFSALLHHGFGRGMRNQYLHKQDTSIYKQCLSLGFDNADDMSSFIISELYNYSKSEIEMEDALNTNDDRELAGITTDGTTDGEKEESENNLDNIQFLDWNEISKEYPLAIEALKEWFLTRFNIEDATVVVEQHTILLTDGTRGVYLNPRDLYDFFDSNDVRPFVIPDSQFPNCKYIIQSKKSTKDFEEVYETRAEAEISSFIKTFYYIEVTIQHEKSKQNEPPFSGKKINT